MTLANAAAQATLATKRASRRIARLTFAVSR